MIGIILETDNVPSDIPNRFLYRIEGSSVIEHTILNCLKAEGAHRVIVAMPALDRRFFYGSTLKNRVINPHAISALDRTANFMFWGLPQEPLKRLYHIAMEQGLDTIVRVKAENMFVPAWLINEAIFTYMQEGPNCYLHTQELNSLSEEQNAKMYGPGLEIEVFPYWMLAKAALYCEDQQGLSDYLATNFNAYHYENEGDSYIPRTKIDLRFKSLDQLRIFETLLHEVNFGADLGDTLGELDEKESVVA